MLIPINLKKIQNSYTNFGQIQKDKYNTIKYKSTANTTFIFNAIWANANKPSHQMQLTWTKDFKWTSYSIEWLFCKKQNFEIKLIDKRIQIKKQQ